MKANRNFAPGPRVGTVLDAEGAVLDIPTQWSHLPPGDSGLTRRVKATGEYWQVQERRGRKVFSRGLWACANTIERLRGELEIERASESYRRRQATAAVRRDKAQSEYVDEFAQAILEFLSFDAMYTTVAQQLAHAVTQHAAPVGSGTVARTKRIPIERRVEAAVIAWLRHQTTAYDTMKIPRIKGKRRETRQLLAKRSRELLQSYRNGQPISESCPLQQALQSTAC